MKFADMMQLAEHGADVYVATGPAYPWGGLYGGQIVAQALRASSATVEDRYRVHSLRAYFIRTGDASEPVRYEVDRIRDGRSFCTRRVVARQVIGAILNLEASYQVEEPTGATQTFALEGDPPDGLPNTAWTEMFDRRYLPEHGPRGRTRAWFRMTDPIGDDPVLQACALAYISDDIPMEAVVNVEPYGPTETDGVAWPDLFGVSLDHTIWFHAPARADDWHLQDFSCHGFCDGRGLAIGHAFAPDGTHVATIAQEVLLRPRRK